MNELTVISQDIATLRSQLSPAGREKAKECAAIITGGFPQLRVNNIDVFVRLLTEEFTKYPPDIGESVARDHPFQHKFLVLEEVRASLEAAVSARREKLRRKESENARLMERQKEEDRAREIEASWETPEGQKILAEIKERVARRRKDRTILDRLERAVVEPPAKPQAESPEPTGQQQEAG